VLDERSFAYWDPGQSDWEQVRSRMAHTMGVDGRAPQERRAPGWQVDGGAYELLVGLSSADVVHTVAVEVATSPDR
jgi:hypothetical protein